jgi:hypothetical protein
MAVRAQHDHIFKRMGLDDRPIFDVLDFERLCCFAHGTPVARLDLFPMRRAVPQNRAMEARAQAEHGALVSSCE